MSKSLYPNEWSVANWREQAREWRTRTDRPEVSVESALLRAHRCELRADQMEFGGLHVELCGYYDLS